MRSHVIDVQSEKYLFTLIANNSVNKNHTANQKNKINEKCLLYKSPPLDLPEKKFGLCIRLN